MKPVRFVGRSLDLIRAFPPEARREAGHQLDRIQRGLEPADWKWMRAVGPGVREIRIHQGGQWRVIYVTGIGEQVAVLYAFSKKARRTPVHEINVARKLYKEITRRLTI